MSLMLAATEVAANLTEKIRSRIAEGAPVWEVAVSDMPVWLAGEVGERPVQAVFQSEHAAVAVLQTGRAVVRRARGN